jgi:hypothetical protein
MLSIAVLELVIDAQSMLAQGLLSIDSQCTIGATHLGNRTPAEFGGMSCMPKLRGAQIEHTRLKNLKSQR